ncbi:MAG: ribosomal protein S18-alanine N-acetyltransferase [Chloroflexi bacterium]|nr:ribosomal protein S18-alanine N-acetyltransferase [Chloroflexota bacterium]
MKHVASTVMPYAVRPMRLEDVPQVTEVDREAFPTMWPPPPFKRELNNDWARYLVAWQRGSTVPYAPRTEGLARWLARVRRQATLEHPPQVVNADFVVGYAGLWFAWDEAHLTGLAVRASYQRRGIGELLLIASLEMATAMNSRYMVLETRVSNRTAQALYEKYGFNANGVRRAYYTDNGEDALVMITDVLNLPGYQEKFNLLKQAHAEKWGTAGISLP